METNPNPNSMKFVVNSNLFPDGRSFDFPSPAETGSAPLAAELFSNFPFVIRVFFMNNFVTITKKFDVEWIEVQEQIRQFLYAYLEEGKNLLDDSIETAEEVEEDETVTKIKTILEEYVKPAVEMDGGAITYQSYEEGTLKVVLQGSCSGCPSSMVTLKAGIENLFQQMMPEVKEVVAEEM